MKANLVAIKDCVVKAKTWNPVVDAKDKIITYIDIAAVDKDLKKIVEPTLCSGSEAPSRARQLVQTNDVLVSTVRPNLNSVAVVTEEFTGATASTGYTVLRPLPEILDSQYLFHWVKTNHFINEMVRLATGQSYPAVSDKIILNSKIPLPPLAEQRRIASILDQADELRQKRQQVIEKLDQLLQATFIDMFGDPVSNPKGWDLKPVGEISESKLGKMLDKKKQSSEKDQHKYLRNANVQWFRFDLSDVFEMEFNEKDRKNCELKFGDILVCEGGEPGRAAIWKNDLENCFFQKALHRVRLDMTQILPEYFVWLFWFNSKNGGFDDHITVATIAHLTGVKMKAMQIPIPPLSLQQGFQQKVNEIEVLKTTLENSSKLFESLFSSLQNQAFSGNL
ncbi:restriction endonuclease subunit S [Acinetobacter tandoii]